MEFFSEWQLLLKIDVQCVYVWLQSCHIIVISMFEDVDNLSERPSGRGKDAGKQ